MSEKCPRCGLTDNPLDDLLRRNITEVSYRLFAYYKCPACDEQWGHKQKPIDPTELLDLIEKAITKNEEFVEVKGWDCAKDFYAGRYETLVWVKQFLSGNPKPLKKLAGVEE